MEDGRMQDMVLGSTEGEVVVRKGSSHRIFPVLDEGEEGKGRDNDRSNVADEREGKICTFLLWGEQTREAYRLDLVFFENWYGYQDEVIRRGGGVEGMSVVQVMSVSLTWKNYTDFLLLYLVPFFAHAGGIGELGERWGSMLNTTGFATKLLSLPC